MTDFKYISVGMDTRAVRAGTKDIDRLATSGNRAERSMNMLRSAAVALGVSLAVRKVTEYADAWVRTENQLRIVTDSTHELEQAQKDLLETANDTRAGFETTVTLYSRLRRSTKDLGLDHSDLLRIVTTVNKSFASAGATTQEMDAAIRQLTQGLQSGTLRGDEFNSVAEQAPDILRAVAKHLNMAEGDLRAFAAEGKITAKIIVESLQAAEQEIADTFAKSNRTLAQSFIIAKNNLTEYVGSSEVVQSVTKKVGDAIVSLTGNLHDMDPTISIVSESFRYFFEDTNEGLKIVDANFEKFWNNIGLHGISVTEVLTNAFSTWVTNTKSLIQIATVETAAFVDLFKAKWNNQYDANAREAAEKNVADARLGAIDQIIKANGAELESMHEMIAAAAKGREAFEELMAARRAATGGDGLLNDDNFAAWLAGYEKRLAAEKTLEATSSKAAQERIAALAEELALSRMTTQQQAIYTEMKALDADASAEQRRTIVELTKALNEEDDANQDVINSLAEQLALIRMSSKEQAVYLELKKLDVNATDAQREAAIKLAQETAKDGFKSMSEYAKQAAHNMQDAFADFLFDPFENGIDGMLDGLHRIATQAAASKIFEEGGKFLKTKDGAEGMAGAAAKIGKFLGFFDNGGSIPSGSFGVMSEKRDEMLRVGNSGVLVKGPANVVGGAATAASNNSVSIGAIHMSFPGVVDRETAEAASAMIGRRLSQQIKSFQRYE